MKRVATRAPGVVILLDGITDMKRSSSLSTNHVRITLDLLTGKYATQDECAKALGVSHQRVHQIFNGVLTRLRCNKNSDPQDVALLVRQLRTAAAVRADGDLSTPIGQYYCGRGLGNYGGYWSELCQRYVFPYDGHTEYS